MTEAASSSDAEQVKGRQRMLGLLLAAAMFVLVVDTSLMNVSISAVVLVSQLNNYTLSPSRMSGSARPPG
jgi:hypothetical protein